MKDINQLNSIKNKFLDSLEDMFPKTVYKERINPEGHLLYFLKISGTNTIPVIDYERKMPKTLEQYKSVIQQSANEMFQYIKWNI